jgi:hypothetical protein
MYEYNQLIETRKVKSGKDREANIHEDGTSLERLLLLMIMMLMMVKNTNHEAHISADSHL